MKSSTPNVAGGERRAGGGHSTMPPPPVDLPATTRRIIDALRTAGTTTLAAFFDTLNNAKTSSVETVPVMPVPVAGSRTLPLPLRIMVCLDESGSTTSTDPSKEGHRAALLVCDWLNEHSQDARDRIGLVRFADRADPIAPTQADKAHAVLAQHLAKQRNIGGGTRLAPAIDALCELLKGRRGERRLALLITDGQVSESQEELRRLFGQLRAVADAVYLIALDADRSWQHTRTRYEPLGLTSLIPLQHAGGDHLAAVIARLLAHEAGLAIQ